MLLLSTSTIEEFFNSYEKLVPNLYVPTKQLLVDIINEMQYCDPSVLVKYIPRLWSDVNTFCHMEFSIKLIIISLMKNNMLLVNSSLKKIFTNAAWNCWNDMKVIYLFKLNLIMFAKKVQ